MANKIPPTPAEQDDQLAYLLRRAKWPLSPKVFAALVNKTVSTPIELAVFDNKLRILLFDRKDDEYEGYHMPGTVLRDNETVPDAVERLLKSEVVGGNITPPISLGWKEITKGDEFGQDPNRHQISLLHACWLTEPWGSKQGEFFSVDELPENTLSHHRVLIKEIVRRLNR